MPRISVFKNVSECNNPINSDLLQHIEDIRDGMWKDITEQCRAIKDEDERNKFKREKMPTATLSGEFSYRNDSGLVEHSGILAMDLDYVPDLNKARTQLIQDKYVFSLWLSPSATGYRVLFLIDENKHRESFRAVSNYLYDKYGLTSDQNGINVSKPYIVSYDPLLYLNFDATPKFEIKKYFKETVVKPIQNFVHTDSDFKEVLSQVIGRHINLCEDYNDWCKIGFAIAEKFGEEGRGYFHQISQQSQKYKQSVCDAQYKRCLKGKGGEKANIATFYYFAKNAGVSITSEQTKKIVRATKNGKRSGLKKEQIVANLKKFDNIEGAEKVVENVFDSQNEYEDDEESIIHVLEMFISNNYSLKMNDVTGYIEKNGKIQTESDLNTIFIAAKKIVPKLDFKLMMRLFKSDFIETYNPFLRFLGSDGIPSILPPTPIPDYNAKFQSPLIDLVASTIINDKPAFTVYFFRKWFVSIISAMHKVHSPLLHTLLGPIGTGKTEFYRRLLPMDLLPYYQQSKLDKGKDDELLMCENLIILDDEFAGKSKQDTMKLNSLTSQDYFSLRRPYGDHNEKVLRYAVLCGTSNFPRNLLPDSTVNRRIIPTDVININKELFNKIDKMELFQEAYQLYKDCFDWRVLGEDIPYLNEDAEKYEVVIKERDLIEKYYQPGDKLDDRVDYLTTTDVVVELEFLTHQRLNTNSVGRELERLGFVKKSIRMPDGRVGKKWFVLRNYDKNKYN